MFMHIYNECAHMYIVYTYLGMPVYNIYIYIMCICIHVLCIYIYIYIYIYI